MRVILTKQCYRHISDSVSLPVGGSGIVPPPSPSRNNGNTVCMSYDDLENIHTSVARCRNSTYGKHWSGTSAALGCPRKKYYNSYGELHKKFPFDEKLTRKKFPSDDKTYCQKITTTEGDTEVTQMIHFNTLDFFGKLPGRTQKLSLWIRMQQRTAGR